MQDLISRQAAIDALEESKKTYFDRCLIIGKMQDVIADLPSAQPEPYEELDFVQEHKKIPVVLDIQQKGVEHDT